MADEPEQKNRCIYWGGDVRSIAEWRFEGGGFLKVVATDDVPTEKAIEWVERLLAVKREELLRMQSVTA